MFPPFPRIGPYDPPPWIRAMVDVYTRAAVALDPDEYGRAVVLRERWQTQRADLAALDGVGDATLRRLRFYRQLYRDGRLDDWGVRDVEEG